MGPDEVGSHPASASPFGVLDLSGNAYEWTSSVFSPGERVARGGSFFHDQKTAQVVNRSVTIASLRDATVGLRVCADVDAF
jgi:formylglycine-generating enzyme required for sulfatase activity